MTKEIDIREVKELKHGVSAKGPWQLLKITAEDDESYLMFGDIESIRVGVRITADVESKPGKANQNELWINRILSGAPEPSKPKPSGNVDLILKSLTSLHAKVDRLLEVADMSEDIITGEDRPPLTGMEEAIENFKNPKPRK